LGTEFNSVPSAAMKEDSLAKSRILHYYPLKTATHQKHLTRLSNAEMTGHLWISMIDEIKEAFGISKVSFDLM